MRAIILTFIIIILDILAVKSLLLSPAEFLKPYFKHQVRAVGHIEPLSVKINATGSNFVLNCSELYIGNRAIDYHDKLRVYASLDNELEINDQESKRCLQTIEVPLTGKVEVFGSLEELRSFANPGGFDRESYNWVKGYGGMIIKARLKVLDGQPRALDYFARFNLYLQRLIKKAVPTEAGAVLTGMVLGGSEGLSDETRESFATNGLSHLLSVSGTHLMLLTAFLRLFFCRLNLLSRNLLILGFLSIYACICGLKPPVLRALGMNMVVFGESDARADKGKILCFLCTVFLLLKPTCILDLGFQLSFAACAGILCLLDPIQKRLRNYVKIAEISEPVALTLAAQLATLPILVGNFYSISLISIFSNLFIVPILELATIVTIIGLGIGCIFEAAGIVLIQGASWMASQALVLAAWFKSIPFSTIVLGSLPLACGVLYYVTLLSWLDIGIFISLNKLQRRILIFASCFMVLSCYAYKQWRPLPLTIYFLDVGQGDAAVIVSPEHKIVIIDTGGLKNYDTGSKILTPFLHSLGKSEIDYLIPSHSDFDHFGGGVGLARNIKIKHVILPQEKFYENSIELIDKVISSSNSHVEFAQSGHQYDLGGAVMKIVDTPYVPISGNDASTVIEIVDKANGRNVLFTGDMSYRREQGISLIRNCDVLKVGHHGSKTSSSREFLAKLRPSLAVISCGKNNRYGHPHQATLASLRNIGAKVLRTDENGCIRVELKKEGIEYLTTK